MKTAIIVGAGHRSLLYAGLANLQPERFKIVGVADPNEFRRKLCGERFGFGAEMMFNSAAELAKKGKLADAVINGTMDADHVPTTIPLLEAGYDVLLEKPFAVNEEEVSILESAARRTGRKVLICHVLRYAPFYTEIKKVLLSGRIGDIMAIETAEHVSYHHIANCYVRGKWRREDQCGSGMLMAKCCHDLDLICWFLSGIKPQKVSSLGGRAFFNREHAPAGSGEYCLLDCPYADSCDYSNKNLNLNHPTRWQAYVWPQIEAIKEPTEADYIRELSRKDNPYARCIWKMDNNVVDRQMVTIWFENGAIATHSMIGGTSRPCRKVHIIGTRGEIEGTMDDGKFVVRNINTAPEHEYDEELIDSRQTGDTTGAFGGHGGGDIRLADDFVSVLEGKPTSVSCTSIFDSINGHRIGFAAERARKEERIITFSE